MFVTFTSDAYENITYFSSVAKQLILLMDHTGAIPGAIKAADIPHALTNLQHALSHDSPISHASSDDDEPEISLAKRAIPLINLLQASVKKDCDVLWSFAKSPG